MSRYGTVYQIEVRHEGLGKYRMIRGRDPRVVEQQARAQQAAWNAMWDRRQAVDAKRMERESKEEKKQVAAERTQEAKEKLDELGTILSLALAADPRIDWEALKDRSPYPQPPPPKPQKLVPPPAPNKDSPAFRPVFNLLDRLSVSRKEQKI